MADIITFEERLSLLKAQPYFANLNSPSLNDLASLMQEVKYEENKIIVKEDDLVDSFLLIAQGRVIVSKKFPTAEFKEGEIKSDDRVIATLGVGESIGLSQVGFFSQTGARQATVTAGEKSILLKIGLTDYQKFLQRYPNILIETQEATTTILHMNFIRQLLPFKSLSIDDLKWLAEQVREITIIKNKVIFKQGEMGSNAYLIKEGAVDILSVNPDNTESVLTTLHAPDIFGEAAMLLDTPRSATARAQNDCKLLLINKVHIDQLTQSSKTMPKEFMVMIIGRSRPKHLPGILVYKDQTSAKEIFFTLHNPIKNSYHRLSEMGFFVWNLLDGLRPMRDITLLFHQHFPEIPKGILTAILFDLVNEDFIEIHGLRIPEQKTRKARLIEGKAIDAIIKIMEAKYTFKNIDSALTKIYRKLRFLYSSATLLLLKSIIITGLIVFALQTPHAINNLVSLSFSQFITIIITIDIILLPIVFLHELGHALTTKHFNRKINGVGFGWYWVGPIAFCDTSDMWLASNKQRVIVNLAGIFSDLVWMGVLAWLAFLLPSSYAQIFCWLFSLTILFTVFANLNPILEFDGYYILSDLLNDADLRENAIAWLTDELPHIFSNPKKIFLGYSHVTIFWLSCLCHMGIDVLLAWLVQHYILVVFFPTLGQSYWGWLLPSIVIVLALLSLHSQIRRDNEGD